MKKALFILTIAAACCNSCLSEDTTAESIHKETPAKLVGNPFGDKEEGTLLVRLSESTVKDLSNGTFDTGRILHGLEDASISPVFPGEADAAARKHGLHKWYEISFDNTVSVETAAELLSSHQEVEAIEYSSVLKAIHSSESIEYTESAMTKSAAVEADALPFNDLRLKDQWDLINNGSLPGSVIGADVGVKDAWKLTAGDPRIIVAIFDQGIATLHEDLANSLWVNNAEVNGVAGVDDDGNGYVDDKNGYNFAKNQGRLTYAYNGDHGTHIAGTIAATNNNGKGISSIAGGSGNGDGVRVMSCQIFDEKGNQASTQRVANAFYYAAKQGACIAQCSYGYSDMDGMSAAEIGKWMEESVEYKAMQYFLDPENSNCEVLETNIVVFSAGNYNNPFSLYPGALDGCISVTAFGPDFLPGGYSNYGAGCDIAAPGGDIIEGNQSAPCMILSTGIGINGQMTYVYKYGTSMACPHVAGVVALGASYALKTGKNFSKEDFISRLLASANDIDSYNKSGATKLWVNNGKYESTDVFCKKGKMGTGAVDAWKFLMALEGTPSFMTTPGKKLSLDLTKVVSADFGKYSLEIPTETAEALGITESPSLTGNTLEITCTKIGAGKIRFNASVGKDDAGVIPELGYCKEISIVSRPSVASNGGWL